VSNKCRRLSSAPPTGLTFASDNRAEEAPTKGPTMSFTFPCNGFDVDLRVGEASEDALVHVMLESRVEVKHDRLCRETGNLFVEYRHRDRPSGLSTTLASRWAFEYDEDCWLIVPTSKVKAEARRAFDEGMSVTAGDRNDSQGVLIPIVRLVTTAEEKAQLSLVA